MNDLVIWNGLTNGLIHPGQKVVVKPDTLINNGLQHQVLPNESVWSISHKYGIAMADFRAWNNIQ
ncbi:LysM peptidoglycan-binding domain-containing protein, partial [Streptococcus danieliae]|nr:LysM peptidoglycan-binding domain-containing protein [Streptococcus danieliae]